MSINVEDAKKWLKDASLLTKPSSSIRTLAHLLTLLAFQSHDASATLDTTLAYQLFLTQHDHHLRQPAYHLRP